MPELAAFGNKNRQGVATPSLNLGALWWHVERLTLLQPYADFLVGNHRRFRIAEGVVVRRQQRVLSGLRSLKEAGHV